MRYCSQIGDPPIDVLYVVEGFEVKPETRVGFVAFPSDSRPGFIRSDANGDKSSDMSDALFSLNWLFLGGPEPPCREAADANGSGVINLADPIFTLQSLFDGGAKPPAPYPECGLAPIVIGCREPACKFES